MLKITFDRFGVESDGCEGEIELAIHRSHLVGVQLLRKKKWAIAKECFEIVFKQNAQIEGIHYAYAVACFNLGDLKNAEKASATELQLRNNHRRAKMLNNLIKSNKLNSNIFYYSENE